MGPVSLRVPVKTVWMSVSRSLCLRSHLDETACQGSTVVDVYQQEHVNHLATVEEAGQTTASLLVG